MSVAHRAVRGAAFVLVSSYANMAIGIVYGIIIARLLDPDHFGVFALAFFFFTLFDVRGKLGLEYAFVHRQPTTDELFATHFTLQIAASVVSLVLTTIFAAIIAQLNYPAATAPLMIALAGALIIEALGAAARAALEKELVFARSTVVVTGALVLSYVAAILLALAGFTYWALVGQVAVNALIGAIGFWWTYRRVTRGARLHFRLDRDIARWMLRFGAVMSAGALATVLLLQFDNFLVGTFVGAAALGFYALAYKVAQWPTGLVTHIIGRVSLPTYAKLQNDPARLGKAFEMSLWLILTVALPLALALFVAAPDFLILLYGEKWLPSAILLRFLVGYSVLRPLLDDTGALFTASGKPERITTVLVVQAGTLIVVGIPLTLAFAAIGTAIAVGVAFVVGIALTYRFIARAIPIDLLRVFAPSVLAALVSIALYFVFTQAVNLNALPLIIRVIVKGGVAGGLYGAIIVLIERRAFFERVGYIARLARGNGT
ncbi:MAG: oligosaccharide flippase family protein [Anaerolineales bacterium]|nr:oligosaccharide flippase family protein [Anaerolineales bacterium]